MTTPVSDIPAIRVLIVEDETIIAMDITRKVRQMGCDVVGRVVSGEQALMLKPDVVLMDIKLRGRIDGIAAAKRIRQQDDISVIFLSAFLAHDSVRNEAAPLSVAMLPKPFDPFELKEAPVSHSPAHWSRKLYPIQSRRFSGKIPGRAAKILETTAFGLFLGDFF